MQYMLDKDVKLEQEIVSLNLMKQVEQVLEFNRFDEGVCMT